MLESNEKSLQPNDEQPTPEVRAISASVAVAVAVAVAVEAELSNITFVLRSRVKWRYEVQFR